MCFLEKQVVKKQICPQQREAASEARKEVHRSVR